MEMMIARRKKIILESQCGVVTLVETVHIRLALVKCVTGLAWDPSPGRAKIRSEKKQKQIRRSKNKSFPQYTHVLFRCHVVSHVLFDVPLF
jgi:hypothetical protein